MNDIIFAFLIILILCFPKVTVADQKGIVRFIIIGITGMVVEAIISICLEGNDVNEK